MRTLGELLGIKPDRRSLGERLAEKAAGKVPGSLNHPQVWFKKYLNSKDYERASGYMTARGWKAASVVVEGRSALRGTTFGADKILVVWEHPGEAR